MPPPRTIALAMFLNSQSERFQAKWVPVRVKKTRQNKKLEPRFDSIETGKALDRSTPDNYRTRIIFGVIDHSGRAFRGGHFVARCDRFQYGGMQRGSPPHVLGLPLVDEEESPRQ